MTAPALSPTSRLYPFVGADIVEDANGQVIVTLVMMIPGHGPTMVWTYPAGKN